MRVIFAIPRWSTQGVAVLRTVQGFRGRMSRIVQSGEDFRDMAGTVWLPRVAACICAAHHMEHQLR